MEFCVGFLPIIVVCLYVITVSIKFYIDLTILYGTDLGADSFLCNNMTKTNQMHTIRNQPVVTLPQMCFLEQAGNLLWVFGSLIVYVKYRQVKDICNRYGLGKKKDFNRITLQVGLIACFGISILVNFQETENYLFYIHWCGEVLFFGFGSLYQSMQTGLYFCISKIIGQTKIIPLRIILSTLSVVSFAVFFAIAMLKNHMWSVHECGIISLVSLLICAISTMVYLVLFYWEFIKITLYEPDFFVIEKFTSSVNMQRTNEAFEDS